MSIAIVTVTFNDKQNLIRTFESIRKSKKEYHRYYVIDGDSIDGSLEVIKDYLDIIDDFISEKDSGIYDAMNKALNFKIKENDFILWLNAGDELLDWNGIDFKQLKAVDCAFYSVLTKMQVTDIPSLRVPFIFLPYNEKNFFPKSQYMHQGFLIRRSAFEVLKYNTEIGLQAENLLMSQCIQRYSFFTSSIPISNFYLDGISNFKFKEVHESYLKVAKSLGFDMIKLYCYQRNSFIKYYFKRLLPFSLIQYYRKKLQT